MVRKRGKYTLAYLPMCIRHASCLRSKQLKMAIASGGFLVEPHDGGRYDMRENAANDPYTQCGFSELLPVSHLKQFTVRHLPANKWSIRPYRASAEFHRQIDALLTLEKTRPAEGFALRARDKDLAWKVVEGLLRAR